MLGSSIHRHRDVPEKKGIRTIPFLRRSDENREICDDFGAPIRPLCVTGHDIERVVGITWPVSPSGGPDMGSVGGWWVMYQLNLGVLGCDRRYL